MHKNTQKNMNVKWYLQTWIICLFFIPTIIAFVFPVLSIFPIAGIVFIFKQSKYNKALYSKYGDIDDLENKIEESKNSITSLEKKYEEEENKLIHQYEEKEKLEKIKYDTRFSLLQSEIKNLKTEKQSLQDEINSLLKDSLITHYNFSDYDNLTSEECKNKLSLQKLQEKELINSGEAVIISSSDTKSVITNNLKQILRCFNSESDNIITNISTKNIDSMRNKINKSYETLNKIFSVDGVKLSEKMLELKLEQLNLVYTYELKREQEIEIQKEIKAQMVEEEKVRREIEKEKKKIEKDQLQFSNEINKLIKYVQSTSSDVEKELYIEKIKTLEEKIKVLEIDKETVLERENNAKAGFVYIISNIGSFGENIYKIGMTRRLEPMDRIKELSSASVPFEFDVHAMIFSDDAPALETKLHQHFKDQSVNKVNLRKEFFKVSLTEIEDFIKENFNNTVQFTYIPVAKDYRQSLAISNK